MTPDPALQSQVTSLTYIFTLLGLGPRAAGIASLVVGAMWLLSKAMPYLPVATAASSKIWKTTYGLIARLTDSWGKASPMPPAGAAPAGGIVPTPPALKQ